MTGAPLLAIRDLAISFRTREGAWRSVVGGVSLTLQRGAVLGLVGESGCGKSVTALAVLRLLGPAGRVDRGQVLLEGNDLLALEGRRMRAVRGAKVAMIFQEPMTALNPVMSVGQQIAEAVRLHRAVSRRQAQQEAGRCLEEVGLPGARIGAYPHELSGGMRQRVMIAMALACGPSLLLADEPTTALDATVQARILDLIVELRRRRGMAVILITHDLWLVATRADSVAVMYAGRIVEYGPVAAIFGAPRHPYTRALLACRPNLRQIRPRLSTVAEVLQQADWRHPGAPEPWWPQRPPPPDVRPDAAGRQDALVEVGPGHWMAAWRSAPVAQVAQGAP
jgi:ABC-type dipeptide/oligopeptide/nickel transport system ATPase component